MRVSAYKVKVSCFTIFAYIAWVLIDSYYEKAQNVNETDVFIVSWLGIAVFLYFIVFWKKLTGRFLTLFTLFLLFFTVFNFGQSFLWAIGIHTDLRNEFGNSSLYGVISYDTSVIVRAQLLYVICYITLNCGATLLWKSSDNVVLSRETFSWNEVDKSEYRKLYITSSILLAIALPATMFIAVRNFYFGQIYSYHDLYYGDIQGVPTIISILDGLFFPALIGVLIGKNYEKKTRNIIYFIFLIYAIITLMCGDRGEWINKFAILFWAHTWFCRRVGTKQFVITSILGIVGIYVITPFVELRNVGLTVDGIKSIYSNLSYNPIVSMLVEFGHSMGISMVLINDHVVFPYGNSYLMSFLTILSTRWLEILFGIKYVQVSTWFSSDYLHILYGADFSMIGEAILNFGVYLAPIIVGVLGAIVSRISLLPSKSKAKPIKLCLAIAAMEPILKMSRSIFWYPLTRCAYFIILFTFVYILVSSYYKRKA